MISETKIDKFGRVLIPRGMRKDLGLEPGARLIVEEKENELSLRPAAEEAKLVRKGKVLIAKVESAGDLRLAVGKHRRDRLSSFKRQDGR